MEVMASPPDPADRPLVNVEQTVTWLLNHLSGNDLTQFESQLPRWDAQGPDNFDPRRADAAVMELSRWLSYWIERATG
jgi:hypothetical protein